MSVRILIGDCREKLRDLPDQSVHCCVTSPPYFGLRDYGTADWHGGDAACPHIQPATGSTQNKGNAGKLGTPYRDVCGMCGATRIDRQMGLEPTPDEFVAGMVEVFREVRRVLRDDGTLWLNIGDSYSTHAAGKVADPMAKSTLAGVKTQEVGNASSRAKGTYRNHTLPEKNLIGVPWKLAFALQADGWVLRQDIIWSKPNPMPESVRDRCTKAHEQIFLLSKGPRYYFDAEAIAEPVSEAMLLQMQQGYAGEATKDFASAGAQDASASKGRIIAGMRKRADRFGGNKHNGDTTKHSDGSIYTGSISRNKRSVWTVTTQPFSEAHFATYPPALIEPCILAGCPVGGTVLDPFGGAGTTGLVADRLGRNAILIELNPKYAAIAERRLTADAGMFAEVKAA